VFTTTKERLELW